MTAALLTHPFSPLSNPPTLLSSPAPIPLPAAASLLISTAPPPTNQRSPPPPPRASPPFRSTRKHCSRAQLFPTHSPRASLAPKPTFPALSRTTFRSPSHILRRCRATWSPADPRHFFQSCFCRPRSCHKSIKIAANWRARFAFKRCSALSCSCGSMFRCHPPRKRPSRRGFSGRHRRQSSATRGRKRATWMQRLRRGLCGRRTTCTRC